MMIPALRDKEEYLAYSGSCFLVANIFLLCIVADMLFFGYNSSDGEIELKIHALLVAGCVIPGTLALLAAKVERIRNFFNEPN